MAAALRKDLTQETDSDAGILFYVSFKVRASDTVDENIKYGHRDGRDQFADPECRRKIIA